MSKRITITLTVCLLLSSLVLVGDAWDTDGPTCSFYRGEG